MRLILALLTLLVSVGTAWAGPVVVTSGEHKDFTRIVLQFDGKPDWQFGRTLDGYALRVPGQALDYDLTKAFDLIGKSRLAALGRDPNTGDLALGIACACHAMPFEFRPGIVVIDLYDGEPPPGSSFEQPLPPLTDAPPPAETGAAPPTEVSDLAPPPDAETLVSGYDWTKLSLEQMGVAVGEPAPAAQPLPATPVTDSLAPDLDKLRESLVQQMGAGATAGFIELAPPPKTDALAETTPPEDHGPAPGPAEPKGDPQTKEATAKPDAEQPPTEEHRAETTSAEPDATMMRSHLGETPAIQLRDVGERAPPMTAEGGTCIPEEELDLAAWGSDRPVAEQMGPIRQGMIGEFDKPSAEAIKRVVRFYLFVGFGAEARSLLRSYPDLFPEEAPIWTAMAHLIDGEPDATGTFSGMADCDTPAALWAVLSDPAALPRDDIGRAAVARSFSSYPPEIRRLLGPRLVEAYLDAKDIPTATAISEAVLRAPGDPGPEVVMMQADMARALGHNGEAEAKLEPLASAPGPASTDALVDLVEHRATLGQRVSEEEVLTLESALKEREGSPQEERYRTALVLAKAASGDYDSAFAETQDPDTLRSIWRLLAQAGGDTPLLNHATVAEGQSAPDVARESAALIADRMLMLGLSDQAARWLDLAPNAPALLQARIALANGAADRALELIKEDGSEQALHLKAQALLYLGDQAGAAKVYEALGKADQQWSALSAAQSWDELSKGGPDQWKTVAGIVTGEAAPPAPPADPTQPDGPLAQDKRLVDESATTRDAITNLLNSVQVPGQPSQ
jgi:hypothetical protein